MSEVTTLHGYTSMEDSYQVDDYPYGYTLRCKIRYWMEWKDGKGFRHWSQTTNPRKAVEVWNKPKSSVYCRYGGVLLRKEDNGHIFWNGLSGHENLRTMVEFKDRYAYTMPESARHELDMLIEAKTLYDSRQKEG